MQILNDGASYAALALTASYLTAGILCAALAPLVLRGAVRLGVLDNPSARKVHEDPIPRLGGVAVIGAVLGSLVVLSLLGSTHFANFAAPPPQLAGLIIAIALLIAVGVLDDVRQISAGVKLAVEVAAALIVVLLGWQARSIDLVLFEIGPGGWLAPALMVFWLVAVTNAVNMIDGLDGLAGGIGAVGAATIALIGMSLGNDTSALTMAALAGALSGFLIFNGRPARVFLGDSGSLPVGFLIGVCSLYGLVEGGAWRPLPVLLVLGIPLADLTLSVVRRTLKQVTVIRGAGTPQFYELQWEGTPRLFRADNEHIHHRLSRTGLGHRHTVLALYGITAGLAVLALVSAYRPAMGPYLFIVSMMGLWYASSRWLYEELRFVERGLLLPIFDSAVLRNRGVHALVDAGIFALGYWTALLLVSGVPTSTPATIIVELGVAGLIGVAVLGLGGTYELALRQIGAVGVGRLIIGSLMAVALTATLQFGMLAVQRALAFWVLFGLLTTTAILLFRASFTVLHTIYERNQFAGRKALIYGAGQGGRAVAREMLLDMDSGFVPVGFIDDDPSLFRHWREGFVVYGGIGDLQRVVDETHAECMVLSTDSISSEHLLRVQELCTLRGLSLIQGRFLNGNGNGAHGGNGNGNGARVGHLSDNGARIGNGNLNGAHGGNGNGKSARVGTPNGSGAHIENGKGNHAHREIGNGNGAHGGNGTGAHNTDGSLTTTANEDGAVRDDGVPAAVRNGR